MLVKPGSADLSQECSFRVKVVLPTGNWEYVIYDMCGHKIKIFIEKRNCVFAYYKIPTFLAETGFCHCFYSREFGAT